ncbi:MAG: phage terminase large subunit [Pikeienuella sp.]
MTFQFNGGQQRALDELLTQGFRSNLLYGGSRSGKSFLLTACDQDRALLAPGSRHLIVRKEQSAARVSIGRDTFPKAWALRYPEAPMPRWYDKDGLWVFPNESEIWLGGLNDDKAVEKMLGREYATIHGEEISEWPYHWYTLLRSRLAQVVKTIEGKDLTQRFYGSLNPTTRMHWTYRLWLEGIDPQDETPVDRKQYGHHVINPYDNQENLSGDYLADLESLPERQRKRFLLGEYISDDENALWRREYFKRSVLKENGDYPVEMRRIVVAIDPAISNEAGSDETGIVAMGTGADGYGYVLADESGKYRPEEWARRAISVFRSLNADRIIGEVNQGGDMIEATLRAIDPSVPYSGVRATKGKATRAEPVAALYEQGRIFHIGEYRDLEDQMCSMTTDFDRKAQGWSPDRVDALVWAATELFPTLAARKNRSGAMARPQISMV